MADLDKGLQRRRNEPAIADSPTANRENTLNQESDAIKLEASTNTSKKMETGDCKRKDDLGEINMEAAVNADDIVRAGGFGATDDISSFLPVAVDSTDFEASLRDARDFEEPQVEISRPGLGWSETEEGAAH